MALRTLRQQGDAILHKISKPVRNFNTQLHDLIDDMWDTIYEHDGYGLAAVQVGVLRRVLLLRLPASEDEPDAEDECYEVLNPQVLECEGEKANDEACLSVPVKMGSVVRPTRIKITAQDRDGEPFELEVTDTLAIVLSHEMDHLDGILFLDKATSIWDRPAAEDNEDSENSEDSEKGGKK